MGWHSVGVCHFLGMVHLNDIFHINACLFHCWVISHLPINTGKCENMSMPKWDTCYRDNDNCEQSLHAYYHDNIEEVLEWLQYEEKPSWLPPARRKWHSSRAGGMLF
jgi:hypothetical protein